MMTNDDHTPAPSDIPVKENPADVSTLIDLARRRRTQARALGDDYREAAWFATRVAAEDIDGTGRTPTDAELGAVVRALAQDEADADAKVQEQITRLLEERGR
ncbi:MAG: hypothetical protein IPK24_22535 [Kineosporiaceae bacterium]|nr:hypothetical protein [Kineosporiaceae bacterium]